MSFKRCLMILAGVVFFLAVLVIGLNLCIDPFGVFGDHILRWWSYDETMNPKVAKLSYLEQNYEQYDSYILSISGMNAYPTEQLDQYFGGNFYDLSMLGADLEDLEETSQYVLEHYSVNDLVLSLSIRDAAGHETERASLAEGSYYKVDGSSALGFYAKYLFANPLLSIQKLQCYKTDTYLPQSYRIFDAETGAYDSTTQDFQPISDLDSYLAQEQYAVFQDYPTLSTSLTELEACVEVLENIKAMCDSAGVSLTVICAPMYAEELSDYTEEDQAAFCNALAQVTDYWDFMLSSISYDPRYFYDEINFRSCVGTMALARMFEDQSVYYPDDLGQYIQQGESPGAPEGEPAEETEYTVEVPILMYHSVAEEGEGSDIISASRFEEHLNALQAAGYTAVTFEDLRAYVTEGTPLPEKPVVITFDDGYADNYTLAYPLLQKYQMQATIFAIGVSVGKDTYKDTGVAMIPHFSLEQAAEMTDSGAVSVQSHGFDLHQVTGRDTEPIRQGVLPLEGESEADYIHFLRQDCQRMQDLLGYSPSVFAYPYGYASELSEAIFNEMGIYATVTTQENTNTIIQGVPQSLRQMGRYYMTDAIDGMALIQMLET
jgi:peptidoglycan/xylan/chitin deacetylase (PgdA/CDA1 family)